MAGALTTFGYVPQIIRMLRTKNAQGISFHAFGTLATGVLLWLIYGLKIQAWPVVAANALTFIFIVCVLVLAKKYKQRDGEHSAV